MDYKKVNMGERLVTEVETLSGAGVLFSEEAMTIIETEGKSDRQLLEVICNKLNNLTIELHEVNRKQDEILTRVQKVESQVLGHEIEIQDIKQTQSQVEEKVSKLSDMMDNPFSPEVTVVAVNLPKHANGDDHLLASRLLEVVGYGNKRIVRVMRTPQRQGSQGIFKIELGCTQDKVDVLRRKADLKHSQEFSNVYLRSSMSHVERQCQLNFKMLLKEIPGGKDYRLTGSGRIVKKAEGQDTKQGPTVFKSPAPRKFESQVQSKNNSARKPAQNLPTSLPSATPPMTAHSHHPLTPTQVRMPASGLMAQWPFQQQSLCSQNFGQSPVTNYQTPSGSQFSQSLRDHSMFSSHQCLTQDIQ